MRGRGEVPGGALDIVADIVGTVGLFEMGCGWIWVDGNRVGGEALELRVSSALEIGLVRVEATFDGANTRLWEIRTY